MSASQQHDVAVVGVIVTKHRRPVRQAAKYLGQSFFFIELFEIDTQELLIGRELASVFAQDGPGHIAPLAMQEFEEGLAW